MLQSAKQSPSPITKYQKQINYMFHVPEIRMPMKKDPPGSLGGAKKMKPGWEKAEKLPIFKLADSRGVFVVVVVVAVCWCVLFINKWLGQSGRKMSP